MQKNPPTQTQQGKNKVAASIKFGRVLIIIGSISFFIEAIFILTVWIISMVALVTEGPDSELALSWETPLDYVSNIGNIPICIFMIFAGIGGIAYVKDKGPFVSFCPLAAIIGMVVLVFDLILSILSLIQSKGATFGVTLFDLLTTWLWLGIYSFGWMLAKNWLD